MGDVYIGLRLRNTVAILDFGSQYTKVIARRVREYHVYSEIMPHSTTAEELQAPHISAIILSGGPASVFGNEAPQLDKRILELDKPILGICYGLHTLLHVTGGEVVSTGHGEYGPAILEINTPSDLLQGLPDKIPVWMSHGDLVENLSEDWEIIGKSENDIIGAIQHRTKPIFGTQFHPEVQHTPNGGTILANFLFSIARCKPDWTPTHHLEELQEQIRRDVGRDRVCYAHYQAA
jgi:GMP synthase (glutamine-hydrolysing)